MKYKTIFALALLALALVGCSNQAAPGVAVPEQKKMETDEKAAGEVQPTPQTMDTNP